MTFAHCSGAGSLFRERVCGTLDWAENRGGDEGSVPCFGAIQHEQTSLVVEPRRRDERWVRFVLQVAVQRLGGPKKHCLPCVASRIKRIKLITKIGGTDRSGKLAKTVIGPIIRGTILKINLMQNYSDNSVTANAVYCHRRGGVKSLPPNTEKWLRKRYDENDDNNMSNETKRETNCSMNNK